MKKYTNDSYYEKSLKNRVEFIKDQINKLNDVWAVKELKEYLQMKDLAERTMMPEELDDMKGINSDFVLLFDNMLKFCSITNNRLSSLEEQVRNLRNNKSGKNHDLVNKFDKNWFTKKVDECEKTYKDSKFSGKPDLGKDYSKTVYNRPKQVIASQAPEEMEKFFEDEKELCPNCNFPENDKVADSPKEYSNSDDIEK